MDIAFDSLSDIKTGREAWRIRVRVVRLWKVPSFLNPAQINSIEMVLVDDKGVRIHASIRKQLLYMFQDKVVEGEVYKMSFFGVTTNSGSYRTAGHEFKLVFLMKTKIQKKSESSAISAYGLALTKCSQIKSFKEESVHLVDVVGLLSGMFAEREYVRDGRVIKMVTIEIMDDSDKIGCALFGEYVDILKKKMEKSGEGMSVVVVQFTRIKLFRENVSTGCCMKMQECYKLQFGC